MQHPTHHRKLIYYVAISIDHFIAHTDESVEGFLTEGQHIPDYVQSLRDFDTVLMGRATYEWGYQFGIEAGQPAPTYAHMMQYVFSQSMPQYKHEQLHVIRDEPAEFVRDLKAQDGGDIYLCGGGGLAGHLLKHDLIDDIILKVNPVIFGDGIPLFRNVDKTIALELLNIKTYNNGVIFAHYSVNS